MGGRVVTVSRSASHTIRKVVAAQIDLVAGCGVEGDAHAGPTVKHRYDARRFPTRPNLRQVHLIGAGLYAKLRATGLFVEAGDLGENITTEGIDLLALPIGTRLRLGERAVVELTGSRAPCSLLDKIQRGLKKAVAIRDARGKLVVDAGAMATVIESGSVAPGDAVQVLLPAPPHHPLEPI